MSYLNQHNKKVVQDLLAKWLLVNNFELSKTLNSLELAVLLEEKIIGWNNLSSQEKGLLEKDLDAPKLNAWKSSDYESNFDQESIKAAVSTLSGLIKKLTKNNISNGNEKWQELTDQEKKQIIWFQFSQLHGMNPEKYFTKLYFGLTNKNTMEKNNGE
jgi:hypothetical protein